jgi:hypothetical protein
MATMSTWPDPPTAEFLPKPRRENDLLAYWEWWLYREYSKTFWDNPIGIRPQGFYKAQIERLKDFADKISKSAALQHIVDHCRDLAAGHDLIALLFVDADLFTSSNDPDVDHKPKKIKDRAPSEARTLLRQCDKLDGVLEHVSVFYALDHEKAEIGKIVDTWRTRASRQGDPGPSAITFTCGDGSEPIRFAPLPPSPTPRKRGKRPLTAINIYQGRIRTLVRRAYNGRNGDQLTLEILRDFSPGLLGSDDDKHHSIKLMGPGYAEKKFSNRLKAFQDRLAQALDKEPPHRQQARHQIEQNLRHSLRALCPLPDFAALSSTVADRTL